MRSNEFLKALGAGLRALRDDERKRYIANYAELIDDKLEEGMTEEAAIAELGDPRAIAEAITADAKEQGMLRPRRSPLTVCLLILGSPLWISLMATAFALLITLYAVVWSLIVSVCAVELSLAVVLPASIIYFAANFAVNGPFSLFVLGMGLLCAAAAAACWRPFLRFVTKFAVGSLDWVKRIAKTLKLKGRAIR